MTRLLPLPAVDPPRRPALLAQILKPLRRRRGLGVEEVARRMPMAPRTYQLFEAGGGKLNLERLQRFAEVTDSDPWAILAALAFGEPAFALACAENKLMTAAMQALADFHQDWGGDIPKLDAALVMRELDAALDRLGMAGRARRYPGEPLEDE